MGNTGFFFSPLLLSACYALRFSQFKHLTSENNYISTNHFWIRLNYFQTDFCLLYTAVPLYNLTQFGPVHIKQTWVRLTFKKKTTKNTLYYPNYPSMTSSSNISKCSFSTQREDADVFMMNPTWCERSMKSFSNRCSEKSCFWLLLLLVKWWKEKKKRVFSDPIERVNEWPRSAWCKFG